jgi:hypothetical protein
MKLGFDLLSKYADQEIGDSPRHELGDSEA